MLKAKLVNQFTKSIAEKIRKNEVGANQITSTLINAALNATFVNESCKSTGQVSKSQVIYRKLDRKSKEIIQEYFWENTMKFLKLLNLTLSH